MPNSTYVLITPARNEEGYIEKTIQSVISQTVTPLKWIIVSDGSTDKTDAIVERYLSTHPFITLLRREGDAVRNFGSQVRAFRAGYEQLYRTDYDYIGNLDADVSFPPHYYETILNRLNANKGLGLAGGCIFEEQEGQFKSRPGNRVHSVANAIQLFRRNCFEEIGGYILLKYGGHDSYAEVMARLKKWEVRAFPDLHVYHHKPTLTAEGRLKGGFRQGRMDYALGSSPIFEVFKCLLRIGAKPHGLYSISRLSGFMWGYVVREKRPVSRDFITHLRREQTRKIVLAILHPLHPMAYD